MAQTIGFKISPISSDVTGNINTTSTSTPNGGRGKWILALLCLIGIIVFGPRNLNMSQKIQPKTKVLELEASGRILDLIEKAKISLLTLSEATELLAWLRSNRNSLNENLIRLLDRLEKAYAKPSKEGVVHKLDSLAQNHPFIIEYGWLDNYMLFINEQPMSLDVELLMVTLAHYLSFTSDDELRTEGQRILKEGPDITKSMNLYGPWMREFFFKGSNFAMLIVPTSGKKYSKLEFSYKDPLKIIGQSYDLSLAKDLLKDRGSFFVLFNYSNNEGNETLTVVTMSTTADVVKNSFQNTIHTMVFALLYNGLSPHLKMKQQFEEEEVLTAAYQRENLWLPSNGLLVFQYRFNQKLLLNR